MVRILIKVYNLKEERDNNDEILNKKDEIIFNKLLTKEIGKNDLVIVSDYGHGLISKKSANLICKKSNFSITFSDHFSVRYKLGIDLRNFLSL